MQNDSANPIQPRDLSRPPAGVRLDHILWVGGSPCSGKSTIVGMLSEANALLSYHCDEALRQQGRRITSASTPNLYKWTTTPWNELWMQPPHVLLEEAIGSYREHFRMVLDDLAALPGPGPVLVEGTCLLPECVDRVLVDRQSAIWLVPTEEFQRAHYPRRGAWVQGILNQCEDPDLALQNWMDRDVAFAEWATRQAELLGLRCMIVDGQRTIRQNARQVAGHLGLTWPDANADTR